MHCRRLERVASMHPIKILKAHLSFHFCRFSSLFSLSNISNSPRTMAFVSGKTASFRKHLSHCLEVGHFLGEKNSLECCQPVHFQFRESAWLHVYQWKNEWKMLLIECDLPKRNLMFWRMMYVDFSASLTRTLSFASQASHKKSQIIF